MPSNHLILRHPLLLLPSIFRSITVFSNESALLMRWPKYWSFSFNISPSNEHLGLISFRMDWLDLLAVQGTLKSLLQHHSSKAYIPVEAYWFDLCTSWNYHHHKVSERPWFYWGPFLQRERQERNGSSRETRMLLGEGGWRATTGSETERQVCALGWGLDQRESKPWPQHLWSLCLGDKNRVREALSTVPTQHRVREVLRACQEMGAFQGLGTGKDMVCAIGFLGFRVYWFWPLRRLNFKKIINP